MRTIIRAIALIVPVFAAAVMGIDQHAGILHKDHVSPAKAIGFIAVCVVAGLVLLYATRKKDTGQQRQPARQRARPSYRTGQR